MSPDDPAGLTSTSTRTVLIDAPSIIADYNATTTIDTATVASTSAQ
jgi:hypothetical protein